MFYGAEVRFGSEDAAELSPGSPILKRNILKGVTYGLLVWLVYGIVEFGLTCAILRFFRPELEFVGWQWGVVWMLFGTYALFGTLTGAAAGALLGGLGRPSRDGNHEILVTLILIVVFIANLIPAWPLAGSEYIALGVALVLGISLTGSLWPGGWREKMAFLTNPWFVALLLIGCPWMSRDALEGRTTLVKEGVSVAFLVAVAALAAFTHRYRRRRPAPLGRQVAMAGVVFGILASVVLIPIRTSRAHPARPASPRAAGKPNIVLITMDTVRADHLTVYGYDRNTTPSLGEFARHATVYDHAIASADYTLPTHASIFTGLYPSWHGASLGRPLAPRYVTLAETLRSNGYWTVAAVANSGNLQPALGLNKGFSVYDWGLPVPASSSSHPFYLQRSARRFLNIFGNTRRLDAITFRAGDINQHALSLLQEAKTAQPFFLFLNYMDAHRPWNSPSSFDAQFPGRDRRFSAADEDSIFPAVNNLERHLEAAQKRDLLAKYDSGIAYLDFEIGRLLSRLQELGLDDNTLLVITADHGEAFGEHDLMAHSIGHVYQDLVHVPLLIKYPGQRYPRRSGILTSQVDLMPTILDVAGISPVHHFQGKTLRLDRTEDDAVFAEAQVAASPVRRNPRFRGIRRAVYSGSLKLVTWTEGASEFYDLAADPNETHNVFNDPRSTVLEALLRKWTSTIPRSPAASGRLGQPALERLKSLGYVQ